MRKVFIILTVLALVPKLAFAQFGGSGAGCNGTGTGTATAGQISLNGSTSGTISVLPQAAAGTYNFNMPITAGTAGQALTSQGGSSTAMTWTPFPVVLGWDGALGGLTASAVAPVTAPCTGHFTQLVCTATLTGACTTGPTVNVVDVTGSTSGTGVSPTTTVATLASSAETLTFASGDTIALKQTATTSTCTAPTYHCSATATCP
ncbi:MAG: hypothetical protein KGJ90_01840 [Patescibacteria group bacterium]|nr:hypothetical protein [Patescibacteria group bacterium]